MKIQDFLKHLFIFRGVADSELSLLLEQISPIVREYARREVIYSPSDFEERLGFVIEGECEVVRKRSGGEDILLNTLYPYDSFGVLTLFSQKESFPSLIYAKHRSKILFFEKRDVLLLIERSPTISMNFIRFLADRVDFLNERIATLSGASVECKLASYLFGEYRASGSTELPFKPKSTAERINVGRASLYRALASLSDKGILQILDKTIIINDPIGLERKSK